jgi:hypothetical protein
VSWKERAAKLIDVKSITTIFLAIIFGILTLRGIIAAEQFVDVFKTIIIFYFGYQAAKKTTETKGE